MNKKLFLTLALFCASTLTPSLWAEPQQQAPQGVSVAQLLQQNLINIQGNTLDLSNKNINDLTGLKNIPGIKDIEILQLSNNQLTTLPAGIFNGLDKLQILILANNNLTTLPKEIFKDLNNLRQLQLINNPNLSKMGIKDILYKGKELHALLNHYDLLNHDGVSITKLFQQGALDQEIKDMEMYAFLDLSNRNINNLTGLQNIPGIKSLKILALNNNKLTSLPTGIFNGLDKLETLLLANNQLTTLPKGIFNSLNKLQKLALNNNQALPKAGIKDIVYEGPALQGLLNQLSQSSSIAQLLQQGKISTEEGASGMLDLSYKNIKDLTGLQDLRGLDKVTTLMLQNNALTMLPEGIFNGFNNLESLAMANNQLTAAGLPVEIFGALGKLQMLSLLGNKLTTLPAGIFKSLNNLTMLFLNNNQLTTLPKGIFDNLTNLKKVDLTNNPDLAKAGIKDIVYEGPALQGLLTRLHS